MHNMSESKRANQSVRTRAAARVWLINTLNLALATAPLSATVSATLWILEWWMNQLLNEAVNKNKGAPGKNDVTSTANSTKPSRLVCFIFTQKQLPLSCCGIWRHKRGRGERSGAGKARGERRQGDCATTERVGVEGFVCGNEMRYFMLKERIMVSLLKTWRTRLTVSCQPMWSSVGLVFERCELDSSVMTCCPVDMMP